MGQSWDYLGQEEDIIPMIGRRLIGREGSNVTIRSTITLYAHTPVTEKRIRSKGNLTPGFTLLII